MLELTETEFLRLNLKSGRSCRVLFTGNTPTKEEISKLIELLELNKDTFPKAKRK